jgi:hypothetical protein
MGVAESHHFLQAVENGAYFPGVVTAFVYVWAGIMLLRAVAQRWNNTPQTSRSRVAVA